MKNFFASLLLGLSLLLAHHKCEQGLGVVVGLRHWRLDVVCLVEFAFVARIN